MPAKILNISQESEVIKLYGQGLTIDKIAESFNVSHSVIGSILKKNKIETRTNKDYDHWKTLTVKQEKEIQELYQQNISSNKIAEMFNIDKSRIVNILRRNNIEIKSSGSYLKKLNEEQEKEALKLYDEGLSIDQISRKYSVSHATINKILRTRNIPIRESRIYNKKFTPEQEQEIIDLYVNQKVSVNKIASMFNVEFRTVGQILKDNNIKILTSKDLKKVTPEQELEMISLYSKGYSTYQLAEKYNISRTSVKRIFIRNDATIINARPAKNKSIRRKVQESQYPRIIRLYKQGMTQVQIGQLYDVGEETIRKILQTNNVPTRRNHAQKLSKKQGKEIVKLYQENLSTLKLAEKFNVNKSTIRTILNKNKIEMKGPAFFNKKLTPDQETEIVRLYHEGLSLSKVTEKTNINRSTVTLVLNRNNIEVRPASGYQLKVTPEIEKEIIELFREGLTVNKISEKLNLSSQTVSTALKKNNIDISITLTYPRKVTDDMEKEIAKLFQEGLYIEQIAEIIKLDTRTVSKILKRLNLAKERKPRKDKGISKKF